MITIINPNLFAYSSKIVNPFTKYQLKSLGNEKRICTILTDAAAGEDIDANYVNMRSRKSKEDENGKSEVEVLIRSSDHNKYDGNVIIAAIPFNGTLLPTYLSNYRFRYAEVVDMTDEHKCTEEKFYPEGLVRYIYTDGILNAPDKILYCVIEPNTTALYNADHPHHAGQIHVNIPFAEYDAGSDQIVSNTNMRICIRLVAPPAEKNGRGAITVEASYAPRHMIPKIMGKLKKDCIKYSANPHSVPYNIHFTEAKPAKSEAAPKKAATNAGKKSNDGKKNDAKKSVNGKTGKNNKKKNASVTIHA